MEYYPAITGNKVEMHPTTWMNLTILLQVKAARYKRSHSDSIYKKCPEEANP